MKKMALFAVMAMLLLSCKNSTGAQQKGAQEAIRVAIQDHLAHDTNLNLQSLDTDVKQVTVQGDHAQADVEFRIKGGPGAMQLTYSLEKRDGGWTVTNTDAAGSNSSHPGSGETQGNPHGQSQGESPTMPGASHSLADTLKSFGAEAPPATR